MKRILLIIILLLPIIGHAQRIPIDSATNKVLYTEVVKVEGVSKDELFTRAREWFAKTFRSAQSVLQMDDRAAGKLIGKGLQRGIVSASFLLKSGFVERYTITLTIKDGRYRYEISDFTAQIDATQYARPAELGIEDYVMNYDYRNEKGEYLKSVKGYIVTTDLIGTSISSSIKEAMAQKATANNSKDNF